MTTDDAMGVFFIFYFLFFFYCIVPLGFSHRKFGLLFPWNGSCDRVTLSNLQCLLGVLACPYSTQL